MISTTFEEFKGRILAAGFTPSAASLKDMFAALPDLETMRSRVRRNYEHADEPSHVFAVHGDRHEG